MDKVELKLLVEVGASCSAFLDKTMRNLKCERLQADEAWSFCYAKQKNVKPEHFEDGGYAGDVWAWVAIDADMKLIPSWLLGKRDAGSATELIQDLASRLANRVQLTTDGLKVYVKAVYDAFGENIDYSVLHKSMAVRCQTLHATAPLLASAARSGPSSATLKWSMFLPATSSART